MRVTSHQLNFTYLLNITISFTVIVKLYLDIILILEKFTDYHPQLNMSPH